VTGLVLVILSLIIIAGGWGLAVLIFLTGSRIKQRRSYNFCLTIAFLECLIIPAGTVLGLFTIKNLTGDRVREMFD